MVPFDGPEVTDDGKVILPAHRTGSRSVTSPVLAFLGALWMPTPSRLAVGQQDVTGTKLPETSVLCREALRTRRPNQKGTRTSPEDMRGQRRPSGVRPPQAPLSRRRRSARWADGGLGHQRVPVFPRALKGKAGCPHTGLQATECWDSAVHHHVPDTTHMDRRRGLPRSTRTLKPTSRRGSGPASCLTRPQMGMGVPFSKDRTRSLASECVPVSSMT